MLLCYSTFAKILNDSLLNERRINVIVEPTNQLNKNIDNALSIPNVENPIFSVDFQTYATKLQQRYRNISSPLYRGKKLSSAEIYVCNDIDVEDNGETTRMQVTLENLLRDYYCVIFTGGSGLGKSMFMRHLLLQAAEKFNSSGLLPIFIDLKDYPYLAGGLIEQIRLTITDIDITSEQLIEKLNIGGCLLLFDGLDEMGKTDKENFGKELIPFIRDYRKNHFYISSRPNNDFRLYERFGFYVIPLLPFTSQQSLTLVDRFYDCSEIKTKFINRLNGGSLLVDGLFETHKPFVENPLLLTFMLIIFEGTGEIHSKMDEFYRATFEELAKTGYDRGYKTELSIDEIEEYFSEICLLSLCEEKSTLSHDEFDKYFCEITKYAKKISVRDFLDDLCENIGIMHLDKLGYHFIHNSFQEYFAFVYIKKDDERITKWRNFITGNESVLEMLTHMNSRKVESLIIKPYLEQLLADYDDSNNGYRMFLERMYSDFYFTSDSFGYDLIMPNSYFYNMYIRDDLVILGTKDFKIPHYPDLVDTDSEVCSSPKIS